MKKVSQILALFVLAACAGERADNPQNARTWSTDDKNALVESCSITLEEIEVPEVKISPICVCWADKITLKYTWQEADNDANSIAIAKLLNPCAKENGYDKSLAFVRLSRRPDAEPKKIPKGIKGALKHVEDKAARETDMSGVKSLMQAMAESFAKTGLWSAGSEQLHLFKSPISVQDAVSSGTLSEDLIEKLSQISKNKSAIFEPMPNSVEERLHFFASKIEEGKPITAEQTKEFEEALNLLFADKDRKKLSKIHERFQLYDKVRKELFEKYKEAKGEFERRIVKDEIDDWEAKFAQDKDDFIKIMQALQIVQRYHDLEKRSDSSLVKEALLKKHQPQILNLKSSLTGKSGWIYGPSVEKSSANVVIDEKATPLLLKEVKFNVKTVYVDWPSVTHPLITEARVSSPGWMISDGTSEEPQNELIPRLSSRLIVADKIEIEFASSDSASAIESAVNSGKTVTVSGMKFTKNDIERSGNKIKVNAMQAIGVIDHPLMPGFRVPR